MSEKDLEITLAFRCDQYTLKQRLRQEHARNLTLKALCLDSKRSKSCRSWSCLWTSSEEPLNGSPTQRRCSELCISFHLYTSGSVSSKTPAESSPLSIAVYFLWTGGSSQPGRGAHGVSRGDLRKRYDKNLTELKEARRMIQQQKSSRNIIYTRASPETEESSDSMNSSKQSSLRRRVSISVITNQTQMPSSSSSAPEKKKRDSKKKTSGGSSSSSKKSSTCPSPTHSSESSCSTMTKDDSCSVDDRPLVDPIETPSEAPPPPPPLDPAPIPKPECPPLKQVASRDAQNTNSPMDTLRQRHRSKATLSKKKAEREKKNPNIYRQLSAGTSGSLWKRPVTQWLYRCRWALLGVYLLVLLAVITLTYLWKLNDAAPES
ncbi:serine/arginine repetitive matrix protein 2-like [Sphaeramia orbicularis]|uniref:serine/arginine repetitive matrix protein 2-like n=1 Tax=Sphaeramia orbicularis TaxID=375764 RepID=UPI00117F788D|nr:serine/arginine repetitive matrix protein 2-like [Sphaeramia orbicularis]